MSERIPRIKIMEIERLNELLSDRYRVERELGRGGMAVVYLAHDWNLGRDVALKVLLREMAASLGAERFVREIGIAAKLNHPNILSLHDRGEVDGLPFYTMPFVDGESLRDRLDREKQLPIEEALAIAGQVADALTHAHAQGVVHRDIKPENIMLQGGHALVADFGIARALTEAGDQKITKTGIALGTVPYMAPEQGAGEEVDARSDLYSLGCVLYEMIGGEPPFSGPNAQAIIRRHALDPVPSVTTIRPTASEGVERAITKALAKNPVDRYKTAEHMRVVLSDPQIAAVQWGSRIRRLTGSRLVRVGAAVVVLAVAGTLAYPAIERWITGPPETEPGLVAVLPFEVYDDFERPLDSESITSLVANFFGYLDRYRVLPADSVAQATAELCQPPIERFCGATVATSLGAEYHVTGDVTAGRRDSVSILARIVDVSGARIFPPVPVEGRRDEGMALIKALFKELASSSATEGQQVAAGAAFTTESLVAFASLMNAELYLDDGEVERATSELQRATEADSTYALAWYRRALVEDWNGNVVAAREAATMAVAYAEQLSDHNRRLLEGYMAWMDGDGDTAERAYLSLLEGDPDDFEALMQLGNLYWHTNMVDAIEPLRRAVRLGTSFSAPLYLVWSLAAGSANDPSMLDEADSLARARDLGLELPIAGLLAMREGDSVALAAVMDSIGGGAWCEPLEQCYLPFDGIIGVLQYMRTATIESAAPRLAVYIPLLEAFSDSVFLHDWISGYYSVADPSRDWRKGSGDTAVDVYVARVRGYNQIAGLESGLGQWRDARRTLGKLDALGNSGAAARMALLGTIPMPSGFLPFDIDSLWTELDAWDVPTTHEGVPDNYPSVRMRHVGEASRLYFYGLLSVFRGDHDAALSYADRLENVEPVEELSTKHLELAAGIRATVLLKEDRPAEALAALEEFPPTQGWAGLAVPDYRERFLRAEALQRLGRVEEALPWLTMRWWGPGGMTALAPSHFERGEINEAMGNTEQALFHYGAFVELWRDADSEYQPSVQVARERMAALRGR